MELEARESGNYPKVVNQFSLLALLHACFHTLSQRIGAHSAVWLMLVLLLPTLTDQALHWSASSLSLSLSLLAHTVAHFQLSLLKHVALPLFKPFLHPLCPSPIFHWPSPRFLFSLSLHPVYASELVRGHQMNVNERLLESAKSIFLSTLYLLPSLVWVFILLPLWVWMSHTTTMEDWTSGSVHKHENKRF